MNSYYQGLLVIFFNLVQHEKSTFKTLRKIPKFHLISWCRNLRKRTWLTQSYGRVAFSGVFYTVRRMLLDTKLKVKPSRHTTSWRRCDVVVFKSRRRSTISRRCNNVAKKTLIKRRLRNVFILLLKRRCNDDQKTTLLYRC